MNNHKYIWNESGFFNGLGNSSKILSLLDTVSAFITVGESI